MENNNIFEVNKEFIDFEVKYLWNSFYNCYDIEDVSEFNNSLKVLLNDMQVSRMVDEENFLHWSRSFFEKVVKNDSYSIRLCNFVLDLSRISISMQQLYYEYDFEKKIIGDIGYLFYKSNEVNNGLIKDYLYSFNYHKIKFLYNNGGIELVLQWKNIAFGNNIMEIYSFQSLISTFIDEKLFIHKKDLQLFASNVLINSKKIIEKINRYDL